MKAKILPKENSKTFKFFYIQLQCSFLKELHNNDG